MKKEIPKMLKDVKGLIVKSTKTGRRYLLHDKDLSGKDIYVTLEIVDNMPKDEYSKKIESARIKLNAKKSCICFDTLVTQYITMRNLSKQTEKSIVVALRGFGLDNDSNKKCVENIIKSDLKKSTIKQKLMQISAFYRWVILNQRVIGLIDPTQGIRIKDTTQPRSRTLTDTEIEIFFKDIKERPKEDQLALRLAFFTGARISSIYALKQDSIKGGKIYYYNQKCGRPYQYPCPLKDKETIELFRELSKKDKIFHSTIDALKIRVNDWLKKKFGVVEGETISIHSLRHTFATRAIQAGIAPEIVSRLLDHSSVSTTLKVYAKHSEAQLDQAIEKIFTH